MMKCDRDRVPDGAIVVWFAHVSALHDSLAALEALLDAKERERALRFHFPEDRARFIAGRGLLRHALRLYAPRVPASIEISYSSLGRPLVPIEHEAPRFSISHAHDLVALAFVNDAQVGIDLEYTRPPIDLIALAERIFSEEDLRAFEAFPLREKQLAFYRAWTRKEAYLKARGEGIATGLQEVSVSFSPEKTSSVKDRRDVSSPAAWRIDALPVPEDYIGSLACDDPNREVKCFSVRMEMEAMHLGLLAG
jgi:4'-phosphopantetheinyl transferase